MTAAPLAPSLAAERLTPAAAPDFWLLAVSLAAGLGTARLTQAPGAAHVVGPITATVVAGHLGAAVARRLRLPLGVVGAGGVVAVALATIWGQLLSATRYGIPTPATWRTLVSKFDTAGSVIRSHPTPVPATPEVVLCIATGAGLVAVLSRVVWAWQEDRGGGSAVALLPTFGLFCYTALLSSQVDRLPGVVTYVVTALAFVIVADRVPSVGAASTGAGPVASRRRRLTSGLMAALPAVAVATVAVVAPAAASPALATLKVDALPFPPTPGGQGLGLATGSGPGGAVGTGGITSADQGVTGVRAIDLVDNLKAVLVNRTGDVMFDAQTPLPTYWQVAVLTDFNGTAWLPDPTTEAAAQSFALSPQSQAVKGLPALPEPETTKTFRAQIIIGDLESTLLPLPPTTYAINTDADLVPGFGAVQPAEAAPGLTYVATARVPVNPAKTAPRTRSGHPTAVTTTNPAGPTGSGAVAASTLAPYLQLPTEPAAVVDLAHQIVAGAKGSAAQAAALARWFDSGRYRYTLTPPASSGPDALETFLFTTRAGFCQQFAAAFGVLARIDGLPTRVAVGFTTGNSHGQGRYQITGADAHVWPEVYLGPTTGWTSYEPTPASSGEATGVGVNSGSKSNAQNPGTRSPATTASTVATLRRPLASNLTVPTTTPLTRRGRTGASSSSAGSSGHGLLEAGIAAAVVALLLGAGLWVRRLVRGGWDPIGTLRDWRRRRRRRPSSDPTAEVLAQWGDAARALERARLGRRPTETLEEHTARLRSLAGAKWLMPYQPVIDGSAGRVGAPGPDTTIDDTVDAYARLAALAARASYGPGPCSPEDAADASNLGARVRSGLGGTPRRGSVLVGS